MTLKTISLVLGNKIKYFLFKWYYTLNNLEKKGKKKKKSDPESNWIKLLINIVYIISIHKTIRIISNPCSTAFTFDSLREQLVCIYNSLYTAII